MWDKLRIICRLEKANHCQARLFSALLKLTYYSVGTHMSVRVL